ncbi:HD domain-containing phosphohydrolase [Radicibacter daui]|uniref:HD domain-containing phosphohydrolase n=1 Tax=Radicibacter daui TaxID=3064829 RepID=UPI0040469DB7
MPSSLPPDLPYLIVADTDRRELSRIEDIFRYDFQVVWMRDAMSIATLKLPEGRIGVALVSDTMPRAGADFVEALRNNPGVANTPVVLMVQNTGRQGDQRFSEFAPEAMLTRPLLPTVLRATVQRLMRRHVQLGWQALSATQQELLATTLRLFYSLKPGEGGMLDLADLQHGAALLVDACANGDIAGLLNALRLHDDYTWVHSVRVAAQMVMFGRQAGLNDADLARLAEAGLVHDIGKLKLSPSLLNKQGTLTAGERAAMESHVSHGVRLLEAIRGVSIEAINVTARHHERLDGSGYPFGLKGAEIDEASLLGATCDIYIALTDRRCHKPMLTKEQAIVRMREMSASGQLDGKLVERLAEVAL